MSVLFTYADQQRAAQNSQAELATTGINNPAIIEASIRVGDRTAWLGMSDSNWRIRPRAI